MGLLGTAAKVAVASSVHGRVQRRQQNRWAAQDQLAAAQAAPAVAPPPASSGGDRVERLTQLAELRASGVLTDAEFEAEKARILQS